MGDNDGGRGSTHVPGSGQLQAQVSWRVTVGMLLARGLAVRMHLCQRTIPTARKIDSPNVACSAMLHRSLRAQGHKPAYSATAPRHGLAQQQCSHYFRRLSGHPVVATPSMAAKWQMGSMTGGPSVLLEFFN